MRPLRLLLASCSLVAITFAASPGAIGATPRPEVPPTPSAPPALLSPQPPPALVPMGPATRVTPPRTAPAPSPAPASAPRTEVRTAPSPAPASERGRQVADLAARFVGARYTWGGTSPVTGFDCSGLVVYVLGQVGVPMPRELPAQVAVGVRVALADLAPGDIVFFRDTYKPGLSHAGIYLGDGRFVSALDEPRGVRITDIHDQYWRPRFVEGRRRV